MIETNKIKVYLILHPIKDDVFLNHSYNGNCSWGFDISKAKKFFNSSAAKSYITKIAQQHKYIPRLLEIVGGEYQIIGQENRVKKSLLDKKLSELNRQKAQHEETKRQLNVELERIQTRLNELNIELPDYE